MATEHEVATRTAVLEQAAQTFREHRSLCIGLAILIGSVGLLMGAATTAVSAVFMTWFGFSLVPAMVAGFTSVGILALASGLLIVRRGVAQLRAEKGYE